MLTKRKDGRWQKSVMIDGKRKYFYSDEKTEARAERDIARKMNKEQVKRLAGESFKDVAEEWYDLTEDTISVQTQRNYNRYYKTAIDFFGDKPIKEITIKDINDYLLNLKNKGFGKNTIITAKTPLNLIFNYAITNEYILSNPCQHAKMPVMQKASPRLAASNHDEQAILDSDDQFIVPKIALLTGMRKGEIYGLRWEDIDFDEKIISVKRSIGWDSASRPVVQSPKTKTSIRDIPLLPQLEKVLLPIRKQSGYVAGEPQTSAMHQHNYAAYQKRVGITATMHQLRHSFATIALENGVPLKSVSELLGHSNITVTANVYTEFRRKSLEEAKKILSNVF